MVSWSDGGPNRRAARHPIIGRDRVTRFLFGLAHRGAEIGGWLHPVRVNGAPGFLVMTTEGIYSVMAIERRDGEIIGIRIVVNPEKIAHVPAP